MGSSRGKEIYSPEQLKSIESSEELLVACSTLLSSEEIQLKTKLNERLEVIAFALKASLDLDHTSEAFEYAKKYFNDLPEDMDADIPTMDRYSLLLFNRGEYHQVEKILELWKEQGLTGEYPRSDCNFLTFQGGCFAIRKDFIKAAEYMQQAVDLALNFGLKEFSVNLSINLGVIFNELGRNEESLAILEEAYSNSVEECNWSVMGHALGTLISTLISMGRLDRAETLAVDSLERPAKPEENNLHVAAALQLAKILKLKNDIPGGVAVLEKNLHKLDAVNDWRLSELYYKKLISMYSLASNYEKAFHLLQEFKKKSDEVLSANAEEELTSVKKLMILSAKAREAELLLKKNSELQETNRQLQDALEHIKTLSGIIPVCSYCKKIRNDEGYWNSLENYLSNHSDALLSHSVCPECYEKLIVKIKETDTTGD